MNDIHGDGYWRSTLNLVGSTTHRAPVNVPYSETLHMILRIKLTCSKDRTGCGFISKIRPDRYIGGNIQKARKEKGLTQDNVIAKLQLMGIDMSRSTYTKIETDRINIRVSELIAFGMIFGVDFNFFFEGLTL